MTPEQKRAESGRLSGNFQKDSLEIEKKLEPINIDISYSRNCKLLNTAGA